jgi:DDE superfamily endonuclease
VGKEITPGPQEKRFAAYIEGLAEAAGHADRNVPLKNYCMGLLLPGERKSVEPMAARLAPENVRRMHQSLHHVVADAPWSDEAVLDRCLETVVPAMLRRDPVVAWVVDDTGFPKKGRESVGVARQYCGQVGKQDNCRVAVSLSVSTEKTSMPVAYRLYLPESWIQDRKRRKKTGVPDEVQFQTKPEIALDQIRRAQQRGIPQGRCRLWNRHQFSYRIDEVGNGLCRRNPNHHQSLETRRRTQSGTRTPGQHRTAPQTATARYQSPAGSAGGARVLSRLRVFTIKRSVCESTSGFTRCLQVSS